ncbi:aminopeptidase N [Bowmanella denitrificans]|uniref:Aminopeptidase N n=1 Tax=Bowmanella denitrificans TaxID=366582 RepID=A0ABP3GGQ2_9ALTE
MSESRAKAMRLADYQQPDFLIPELSLEFELDDHQTQVIATSKIVRQGDHDRPLVLHGEKLELTEVQINGQAVQPQGSDTDLTFASVPDEFTLRIVTRIDPANNTSLEGLYKSGQAFCTQCEAEGFRKITYFLDRPDVMARYQVKITADKARYPYLLSNGNKVDAGELPDGRHWVRWDDPFFKPSYLFALVAGDFDLLEDEFITQSGRKVALQIFVDKGNLHRAGHAMRSLKKAMAWDEQKYGLEYDLDIYMIVAVDFFNMGAMENKGLNLFNSKFVLADAAAATDEDYFNIESVIAHEYFHNWTGNRVTCRDWFQLSLKEGLTVFRDQQFSADMADPAIVRIKQVKVMREHQFAEDAGPMSHPIRPAEVMEMNNFYSVTVYDKGAEVIRMLHTLLGEQGFRRGMDLYISRHDGQAVTCDDFVQAMQDANNVNLELFKRWYSQSGTPVLSVKEQYDQQSGQFTVALHQHTPPTADQPHKQALHLPIALEVLGTHGSKSQVLSLTKESQTFPLGQFETKPQLAVLAGFSAPVKLDFKQDEQGLLNTVLYAQDPFLRWDASQQLISEALHRAAEQGQTVLSDNLQGLFEGVLEFAPEQRALAAEMLELPSFETLAQQRQRIDVDALLNARNALKRLLADRFHPQWQALSASSSQSYIYEADQVQKRRLRAVCLGYLAHRQDQSTLLQSAYTTSDNMTDTLAVLKACQQADHPLFSGLMQDFESRWQADSLVMDKWFALHGSHQHKDSLAKLQLLTSHAMYSINNPNKVRALIGSFAFYNTAGFHALDGGGYRFVTDYLLKLDAVNPQVASRLITPMLGFAHLDDRRQDLLTQQLARLLDNKSLSRDLFEKVSKALKLSS